MEAVITPVVEWQRPNPADAIAQINRDTRFATKSYRLHRNELSPLTLYCYLKTRFGPPNGEMMAFRTDSSENAVHWHYKVACNEALIDIWGTNAGLRFISHATDRVEEAEWSKMFDQLQSEFQRAGDSMKTARASIESWTQFVNPFQRIEKAVCSLEEELKGIELEPPQWPPTEAVAEEYSNAMSVYAGNAIRAQRAGFCLRALAPIYAESFVNLILFALRNEVLATSEVAYRKAVRQEIHERVLDLPANCNGFLKSFDKESFEFKNFLRLMNGRNDLVHGNCDPAQLKIGKIHFDGNIPLWQKDGSTIIRMLEHSMQHIEKSEALKDVENVRKFVRWVLEALHPEVARQIRILMLCEFPGIRDSTGQVGVLMPNAIYESYLG